MEQIQDVFGATTVGILAIVVLYVFGRFLRWFYFLARRHEFIEPNMPVLTSLHASILFPVVFAFGLMIQDTTDHLTDTEYHAVTLSRISDTLGSEGRHRLSVLFRDDSLRQTNALWDNMTSQRERFRRILISTYGDRHDIDPFLKNLEKFVKEEGEHAAERYVNTLFYEAKNWAYSQETYFAELQSIQRRIDFARSIFLVAVAGIVFGVIASVLCVIALCMNRGANGEGKNRRRDILGMTVSALATVALSCAVYGLSSFAYGNAQTYFNERAFGYYVSHFQYSALVASDGPQEDADGR